MSAEIFLLLKFTWTACATNPNIVPFNSLMIILKSLEWFSIVRFDSIPVYIKVLSSFKLFAIRHTNEFYLSVLFYFISWLLLLEIKLLFVLDREKERGVWPNEFAETADLIDLLCYVKVKVWLNFLLFFIAHLNEIYFSHNSYE